MHFTLIFLYLDYESEDTITFNSTNCFNNQYALTPDQHNRYQLFLPSLYFVLQAEIIHKHEYKTWRSTGIAFEPREATYDVPNKTLASGVVVNQVSAQIKQSAACH